MKGTLFKCDIWRLIQVTALLIFLISLCGHFEVTRQAKEVRRLMDAGGSSFGEVVMTDASHIDDWNAMLKPHIKGVSRWFSDFVWLGGFFNLADKGYTPELTAKICVYRNWMLVALIILPFAMRLAKRYGKEAQADLNNDANTKAKYKRTAQARRRSAEYELAWSEFGTLDLTLMLAIAMIGQFVFHSPCWFLVLAAIVISGRRLKRYLGVGGKFVRSSKAIRRRRRRRLRLPRLTFDNY